MYIALQLLSNGIYPGNVNNVLKGPFTGTRQIGNEEDGHRI